MTGFDTPFPPLAVFLVAAALIAWALGRRPKAGARASWQLAGLRVAGIALLALLALNPFFAWKQPDPSGFAVAVVGDVSRSMETADLPARQTRLKWLQAQLDPGAEDNLWARLAECYVLEPSTVAASWQPGPRWQARDGDTALGDGLTQLLDARATARPPLGAALLLSDGINLVGERLPEAAVAWREAGIPVSVVGVGEPSPPGDLAVAVAEAPASAPLNEPMEIAITVENRFAQARQATLELHDAEVLLGSQPLELPPNSETTVRFDLVPDLPGLRVFRARLAEPDPRDPNPGNDTAYAAVDIALPDTLSVHYLGARLSPFWRYLQLALEGDEQLALSAVIQTGPERFYRQDIGENSAMEEDAAGFPEDAESLFVHAALIVDVEALAALSDDAREGVRQYLARRGGGVLFLGAPEKLPEDLRPLLPVRGGQLARALQRVPLTLSPQPVFPDADAGVLGLPPGPYLPAESLFFQPDALALGARNALSEPNSGLPALAVHAYGAGRAAYLGTGSTWQWALASERGREQHRAFWQQLVAWLATGGKPRVETPLQGQVVELATPVDLGLAIRGSDFRPSEDARARATVTTPSGEVLPALDLVPEALQPGRYAGELPIGAPGEYRVDYHVEFPGGEALDRVAYFAARRGGRENEDRRFRENALRDLARVSGGRYVSWREADALDALPLAADVPLREERRHWTRHPLFLFCLLAVFATEWFRRRHLGLK